MINTVSIKGEQLVNGYFQDGSGETKILVMGSCRVAPYMNYLHKINENNRYTIYSIDPFNWNWNDKDERTDYEQALSRWETDARMLIMLQSIDVFIHEYYQNAGMFNVNKGEGKTIYHFGMNPEFDICIPNFNDNFIFFKDIINFDTEMRKKAVQDWNVLGKLSEQTANEIYEVSKKGFQRFYDVCSKSDIPEMEDYVKNHFKSARFFHSYNHVSKSFTVAIFHFINAKWLRLDIPRTFYDDQEDIFANSFTPLTKYDIAFYNYQWDEEIKPLI